MTNLDGSGKVIELVPGYRISAQGLKGTAAVHEGAQTGRSGGGLELATAALDEALTAAGMKEIKLIELDVVEVKPLPTEAPIRSTQGEDALVLEVPDLGATVGQVVLAVDEEGVVTWNFPLDTTGRPESSATRGAGGYKRFVIRRAVPPVPPPSEGTKRGLVGLLGKKLLKVIVFPLIDPVLGSISDYFAGRWESKNRPYGLRHFSPENYQKPQGPPITSGDWNSWAGKRCLLFVHGTFSTAHGGFGGIPIETMQKLHRGYQGRVFAFNHFTLSEDPNQNIEWFQKQLPPGISLDADIICHSRGGLVSRTLAQRVSSLRVGKLVFVAAPNLGTPLTDPKHMVEFIDRYTSILNLAPPGPVSVVAEILEGIAVLVKVLGSASLKGLAGLAAMNPKGQFLSHLQQGPLKVSQPFAVTSNFEPQGSLRDLVKQVVADQIMDRVFAEAANDLVVPTAGVAGIPGFPIPAEKTLRFDSDQGVTHTTYFQHPETSKHLLHWLL